MKKIETEKEIETLLRDEVKKIGGKAYKFISPGNNGVPDRIVILPKGVIKFVELKRPGGLTTKLQDLQINNLKMLGCDCYIIDSKEAVKAFILKCKGEENGRV